MHIALIFEYPTLNGGERSLLAVIDELSRQQVAVKFTALAPAEGPLADALTQRAIPHIFWSARDKLGRKRSLDELALSLVDQLRDLNPDLVHANSLSMGRLSGRITDHIDFPCTSHLRDIIGLSAAAMADLNRNARLIAVSTATRDFHVAQGMEGSRVDVLHNGIDLTEFAPRPATGFLHQELGLPREARLIAAIGQIGLRKGWDVLAEAIAHPALVDWPLHWLLIGSRHSKKAESREFESDLRQRFVAAGWDQRVHWLGERQDVSRIFNELDLLVHPARQEPLGRVLIEGLASGVPIVATNTGGTREIIVPNESGLLVPAGNSAAVAEAMVKVLSDEQLAESFRAAGRQRAEACFDIQNAASRLWSIWRRVHSAWVGA